MAPPLSPARPRAHPTLQRHREALYVFAAASRCFAVTSFASMFVLAYVATLPSKVRAQLNSGLRGPCSSLPRAQSLCGHRLGCSASQERMLFGLLVAAMPLCCGAFAVSVSTWSLALISARGVLTHAPAGRSCVGRGPGAVPGDQGRPAARFRGHCAGVPNVARVVFATWQLPGVVCTARTAAASGELACT